MTTCAPSSTILFEVVRGLLSFPNPVNETSARLVAGVVAVIAVLAIAFQQGWLIPVLAYGFVARALAGPKLSPLAVLATRLVTPRLPFRHRYSPGPAKRFAQTIGAVFTLSATGVYFAGFHVEAYALAGVIALFASLEAGFGLCVGCKAFYLGMRLGLVPPSVCEECAPYVRRGAA
jgi:predicted Abi (CAAX) family protease